MTKSDKRYRRIAWYCILAMFISGAYNVYQDKENVVGYMIFKHIGF